MPSTGPYEGRSVFPLRPLGVGEVLDAAVGTIRAYPKATLGPSAVLYGGMLALVLLFSGVIAGLLYGSDSELAQGLAAITAVLGVFGAEAAGGLLQLAVIAAFSTLMAGVVARAALGRPAPLGAVWRDTKKSFGWLLLYALLLNFALVVPMLLLLPVSLVAGLDVVGPYLFVAGLLLVAVATTFFYAQVWLTPAAVVIERVHVMRGIARSWQVTSGGRWRATGIVALAMLICLLLWAAISAGLASLIGLVTYLLSVALTPVALSAITVASTFLAALLIGAVATPFLSVTAAVAYVDQRNRTEGLDLLLGEMRTAGHLRDLPVTATVIGPGTPFAAPVQAQRG